MQNTISDPQWNKQNEFHSSTPGIFCWDIHSLETTNINNNDQIVSTRDIFQGYHTIQLDIISKYVKQRHVELANKAQAHNRGSRLVLLGS